jgi:hypothetical protein
MMVIHDFTHSKIDGVINTLLWERPYWLWVH